MAGKYRGSPRLPSEARLARELGVNRYTLRRAVEMLEEKGLVYTVPHNGIFLAPLKLSFPLSASRRFAEALSSSGLVPSGRLISQRRCLPPPEIAQQLRIAKRSEVFELRVLRSANSKPVSYATIWLPAERFGRIGELFASVGALRQAMVLQGVPDYRRSALRISARQAAEEETSILGLNPGGFVLIVESLSKDRAGEPTHVSMFRFGADRVELEIEL